MMTSTILPGVAKAVPEDALQSLTIQIKQSHAKTAIKCDGNNCVIARAFKASLLGQFIVGVEVGMVITKVRVGEKILRFATPSKLRPFIREFDATNVWNVPSGSFEFKPLSATLKLGARPSRWTKHRTNTSGAGKTIMKPRATPLRRISKV